MASSKRTFLPRLFLPRLWETANFRGTATGVSVTTPPWTVSSITLTRTGDEDDLSIDTLADLVATLLYDWINDSYDGTAWSLTYTEDFALDVHDSGIRDIFNVLATAVAQSPADLFRPHSFTLSNYTTDYVMDCDDTSLEEVGDVLATLLTNDQAGWEWVVGVEYAFEKTLRPHYALDNTRPHYALEDN